MMTTLYGSRAYCEVAFVLGTIHGTLFRVFFQMKGFSSFCSTGFDFLRSEVELTCLLVWRGGASCGNNAHSMLCATETERKARLHHKKILRNKTDALDHV